MCLCSVAVCMILQQIVVVVVPMFSIEFLYLVTLNSSGYGSYESRHLVIYHRKIPKNKTQNDYIFKIKVIPNPFMLSEMPLVHVHKHLKFVGVILNQQNSALQSVDVLRCDTPTDDM